MKNFLWLMSIVIFFSCSVKKKMFQGYYYVEPFKEQEIKLNLKDDSTFSFRDATGCNQFEFVGRFKKRNDNTISYLTFDSVKLQNVLSKFNSDLIFSINNGDTAWIINKERIFIHKQAFIITTNSNINLQEIRYRKLEEYYTGLLGKEGFIKVFGNGESRKVAKKRLLECKLPDINIR